MLPFPNLPETPLPGPPPLPLVGHRGNLLRFFADPPGAMLSLERQFGSVAAVCRNRPQVVCAFGAEHNRRVLTDLASFPHRESFFFDVPERTALGRLLRNMMMTNGEVHRRRRRLLMPAFQKSSVEAHRDTIVAVAERVLPRLFTAGRTVDVARAMTELTLCVSMECLFGVDVTDDAEDLGRLALALLTGMQSPAVMMLPFDLPGTPYANLQRVAERLESKIQSLIARRRKDGGGRDVLSILVGSVDEDGARLSDEEIVADANLLFIAGHETTAQTLTWTLFLLARHPRVLADLEDELAAALDGDAPSAEQLSQLTQLDAVIKESMRLLPATPFTAPRTVAHDLELGGFRLPAGAGVILSPLVTHRSPEVFPSPRRFSPSRWEAIRPSAYEYLPFGAGPRTCIGASFAAFALRVLLPMIVGRYRLSLPAVARVSTKIHGITMGPKGGLPMRIEQRNGARPERGGVVVGDVRALVDLD